MAKAKDSTFVDANKLFFIGRVRSDDNLDLWHQDLEFEIEILKNDFRHQIVVDRVHKYRRSESRPTCFLHFSRDNQLEKILENILTSYALVKKYNLEMDNEMIQHDLQDLMNRVIDNVMKRLLYAEPNFKAKICKIRDIDTQLELDIKWLE